MNGVQALDWRLEWRPMAALLGLFLALLFLPTGVPRFDRAVMEGLPAPAAASSPPRPKRRRRGWASTTSW